MRVLLLAFGVVVLTGCSSKVDEAEADLAMIEKAHPSASEVCAAKRKVADAYLKTRDELKYRQKNLDADIACEDARDGRVYPGIVSDNIEATNVDVAPIN